MAQRKKKSKPRKRTRESVKPPKSDRTFAILTSLTIIAALVLVVHFVFLRDKPPTTPAVANYTSAPTKSTRKAKSLAELLSMSPAQLADVDIAEMNLLCATGLPGAEKLDIDHCLATLDKWAARVKFETLRHLYRLTDPRYKDHAEHYKHSEARFRAEWLVAMLQNDIGVHYHAGFVPQDKASPPFKTSKETFIHGLLDHSDAKKAFGGNCVSLPVIYAAVGRRLGYPIKLVTSKEHVFCRWEGLGHANPGWRARFNFDGAGAGFSIDPDRFYLTWPRKSSPQEVETYDWLRSLTPKKELALFMLSRGHVLAHVNNDHAGARIAYTYAASLHPVSRLPLLFLSRTLKRLGSNSLAIRSIDDGSERRSKSIFDPFGADGPVLPQRAPNRLTAMADLERINEINRRNAERMKRLSAPAPFWAPPAQRRGMPGVHNPSQSRHPPQYHQQGVR